eukprot:1154358-Pelagomonas_calceolata.AAC.17
MMCKVTLLFLFGFLELRVFSLVLMPTCWAAAAPRVKRAWYQGRLKARHRVVLGEGLCRIKVGWPACNRSRAHGDSIGAAFVLGRGASAM